MLESLAWFKQWREDVYRLPVNERRSPKGRASMFLSPQTWWALQQTTYGFIGLGALLLAAAVYIVIVCSVLDPILLSLTFLLVAYGCLFAVKHYTGEAPTGCGIKACRCSQDPLEACVCL